MKIGIITLSASNNCGSMLQCYALKKILEEYGEVEVINFTSEESHRMYDPIKKNDICIKHPRNTIKSIFRYKFMFNEIVAYKRFRKHFLNLGNEEYYAEDLSKIKDKYDVIVSGSDQVWNVKMADFSPAFFSYWTTQKKIAYAPSLGGHDIRESSESNSIIKWLEDYDYLSVREEKGKKCLEDILSRKVEKVLDPTLVINVENWKKLLGEPIVKGRYIFFYSWAYCYDSLLEIVSKRSREENSPVYVIDARKWTNKKLKKWNYKLCRKEGPLAFLNLMYYADKCYVESFHGVIFAYLFKKNFWLLDKNQNYENLDVRLKELVELLNIKERILTEFNYEMKDYNSNINYGINEALEEQRTISKNYIGKALL